MSLALALIPFCHSNNTTLTEDFQMYFAGVLTEISVIKLYPGDPIKDIIMFLAFIAMKLFPRFTTVMVSLKPLSY